MGHKWLEFRGDHQDAFGLQGAANSCKGLREVMFKQGQGFVGVGAGFDGTFKERGENQATLLEAGKDLFLGLCRNGDGERGEKIGGEAGERSFWGIEKFGVRLRGRSSEKESLNVDGTEARGPFETLKASGDVLGGGELAAAIARQ